jgi:hypothetical protein
VRGVHPSDGWIPPDQVRGKLLKSEMTTE